MEAVAFLDRRTRKGLMFYPEFLSVNIINDMLRMAVNLNGTNKLK